VCYTSGMPDFAAPVERLIDELKHLPGIGQKNSPKIGFSPFAKFARRAALALADPFAGRQGKNPRVFDVPQHYRYRSLSYCVGPTRNHRTNLRSGRSAQHHGHRKTRMYSGMYHVLGGALSPLSGRGPEQVKNQIAYRTIEGRRHRRDYCGYQSDR